MRANPTCTGSSTLDLNVTIGGEAGVVTLNGCSAKGGTVAPGSVVYDVIVVHGNRGYDFTMDGHINAEYVMTILGSISFS